jgi:uncharacterized RDD family membrane protein YckC
MVAPLPSIGPARPPAEAPSTEPPPFVIGSWNDPTGVMGRRIGAFVLDALLSLLLTLLAVLFAGGFVEQRGATTCTQFSGTVCLSLNESVYTATTGASWAMVVVPLLYAVVVSVLVQGLTGFTPGKALFAVRVVDRDGQVPGVGRAAARTVFLLVDLLPCCLPLVGLITASTSAGHRRVGDMVATTFVVDRHDTGRRLVMPDRAAVTGPPPVGLAPATPPPAPETAFAPPGTAPPTPTAPALTAPPPPQPQPQPQWDEARGTYVLWDPARRSWLAFDRAAGVWRPI